MFFNKYKLMGQLSQACKKKNKTAMHKFRILFLRIKLKIARI